MSATDRVTAALVSAVADQGPALLGDASRLRATLADLLGADAIALRHDIDALGIAAATGVGRALGAGADPDDPRLLAALTAEGMSPAAARWATGAMVAALRVTRPVFGGSPGDPTNRITAGGPDGTRMGGRTPAGPGSHNHSQPTTPGSAPGRRRGAAVVVAAVVLAAAAGVGGTLWATRGTPDPQSSPATSGSAVTVVRTAKASTATVSADAVTVELLTTTVVTAPTTTVRSVPRTTVVRTVALGETEARSQLCVPMYDVASTTSKAINEWANETVTAASSTAAAKALGGSVNRMTVVLREASPTASEIPLALLAWQDSLLALQQAIAAGGTDDYSGERYDDALLEEEFAETGFFDACDATVPDAEPFTMAKARVATACKATKGSLSGAVRAVRTWAADPTATTAAAAHDALTTLRTATSEVGQRHRISMAHPVRRTAEAASLEAYNLDQLAQAKQPPVADWVAGLEAAAEGMEALC